MKNLLVVVDIDGTIADVGDRFDSIPLPANMDYASQEYIDYLEKVQTDKKLQKDKPVPGMQDFVRSFENSVYVTSRVETTRESTLKWLRVHGFPDRPIFMRPTYEKTDSGTLKEGIILEILQNKFNNPFMNVIVVDDDPSGKLECVCLVNGWTFLKAKSGGQVP